MRRLLAVALVVIGLGGIGLGLLGTTVWAPDTERSATVQLKDPGSAVVIDPGVLYVGGNQGTLTVTGASDVTIIPADPDDIEAYLGSAHYTRITGVPSWTTLSTKDVQATGDATIPSPVGADLWPSVTTEASPAKQPIADLWKLDGGANPPAPYRAILLTTDGTAPGAESITVTWPVEATNAWVPYATAIGAALAVIGLVLFVLDYTSASARRREAAEELEDERILDDAREQEQAPAAATTAAAATSPAVVTAAGTTAHDDDVATGTDLDPVAAESTDAIGTPGTADGDDLVGTDTAYRDPEVPSDQDPAVASDLDPAVASDEDPAVASDEEQPTTRTGRHRALTLEDIADDRTQPLEPVQDVDPEEHPHR